MKHHFLRIQQKSHRKAVKRTAKYWFAGLFLFACLFSHSQVKAQQKVAIDDQVSQHIFSYREITFLEDPKGLLKFDQVLSPQVASQFKPSWSSTPQNYNQSSVYWYKITIE